MLKALSYITQSARLLKADTVPLPASVGRAGSVRVAVCALHVRTLMASKEVEADSFEFKYGEEMRTAEVPRGSLGPILKVLPVDKVPLLL